MKPLAGPPWIDELQVGDVLRNDGGFRVVREVTRFGHGSRRGVRQFDRLGQVNCITLSILRCSWTKRPYTVMNRYDIVYQGYRPAGFRVRLDKPIDAQIARALQDRTEYTMTCCDVVGVVR